MSQAKLKIIFCKLFANIFKKQGNEIEIYNEFILDGEIFDINKGVLEIKIAFNDNEEKLGIKVCHYELRIKEIQNSNVQNSKGLFEVYLGDNIGYCFLDNIGSAFELSFLFLNDENKFEEFSNKEITYSINNTLLYNKKDYIPLKLDKLGTNDRLNLLLINCDKDAIIELSNNNCIEIENIISKIDNFSKFESYQICFNNIDKKDFVYRKIVQNENLNFDMIYNKNKDEINKIYDNLNLIIFQNNNINEIDESILSKIYNNSKEKYKDIKSIIERKYLYGRDILGKRLDKEEYIDFIFKVTFFICIYELICKKIFEDKVKIDKKYLIEAKDRLLKNKDKIYKEKSLKIYEKILLILELWNTQLYLNEKNDELNYIIINNIDKDSPLDLAIKFFYQFIQELDLSSNFYYPLLLIDSGIYTINLGESSNKKNISTHGLNMLSLDKIKSHLIDLMPSVLISHNDSDTKLSGYTNVSTGLISLNLSTFISKGIYIQRKIINEYEAKNYAFLIVRHLMHEMLGHKKSNYSKDKLKLNYNSSISFNDKNGNLLFYPSTIMKNYFWI